MADPRDPSRNPLVIPTDKPSTRRGCPVCGKMEYGGQMIYGVLTNKCRACGNEWQGGIGQVPQDPRLPDPPMNPRDVPTLQFERTKTSDKPQDYVARRPDMTQAFRKGAPIPPPGEEDV
jgi:hypothetical protein